MWIFSNTSSLLLALFCKILSMNAVSMGNNNNSQTYSLTCVDAFFQTPLHLAVITNQADVCKHLLESGCDPTLVDNRGDTPLHIACHHGNLLCFSVITQSCQKEHLHTMMAACNYRGKHCVLSPKLLLLSSE